MSRKGKRVRLERGDYRFKTRIHNRCSICNRSRSILSKFMLCHRCFSRTVEAKGIPGIRKKGCYGSGK